jgi:hypothetical protein
MFFICFGGGIASHDGDSERVVEDLGIVYELMDGAPQGHAIGGTAWAWRLPSKLMRRPGGDGRQIFNDVDLAARSIDLVGYG